MSSTDGYGLEPGRKAVTDIRNIRTSLDNLYSLENKSFQGLRETFHVSIAADEMDVNQDLLRKAEQTTLDAIDALLRATTTNNDIAENAINQAGVLTRNIRM